MAMTGFATTTPLNWREVALDRTLLIEASAGSGKTYTIMLLVLRQILERELTLDQILLTTFTRAAATELKLRLAARLRELHQIALDANIPPNGSDSAIAYLETRWQDASVRQADLVKLAKAIRQLPRMEINTIHGFCARVLGAVGEMGAYQQGELAPEQLMHARAIDDAIRLEIARMLEAVDLPTRLAPPWRAGLVDFLRQGCALALSEPELAFAPENPQAQVELLAAHATCTDAAFVASLQEFYSNERLFAARADSKRWLEIVLPKLMKQRQLWPDDFKGFPKEDEWQKQKCQQKAGHLWQALQHYALAAKSAYWAARHNILIRVATQARQIVQARLESAGQQTLAQLVSQVAGKLSELNPQGQRSQTARRLARRLATRYPVAFVDEFQDTDPQQLAIFRALMAQGQTLCVVGDPKQSIYRFRGADLQSYLGFTHKRTRHTLDVNYRASVPLIDALNALFQRAGDRWFGLDGLSLRVILTPNASSSQAAQSALDQDASQAAQGALDKYTPVDNALVCLHVHDVGTATDSEATYYTAIVQEVVQDIQARLSKVAQVGRVDMPSMAVLARKNRDLAPIQEALQALGIDVAVRAKRSVYAQPAATLLWQLMFACLWPNDIARSRWLRRSVEALQSGHAPSADWQNPTSLVLSLQRIWTNSGTAALILAFMVWLNDLALSKSAQSRLTTDLQHLGELTSEWKCERERANLGAQPYMETVYFELERRLPADHGYHRAVLDATALPEDDDSIDLPDLSDQIRLDQPNAKVVLMTMHGAKGLEFDVVYLPSLWSAQTRRRELAVIGYSADGLDHRCIDGGSAGYEQALQNDALQDRLEQARLAYVAMTRAKCQLHIYASASAHKRKVDSGLSQLLRCIDADYHRALAQISNMPNCRVSQHRIDPAALSIVHRAVTASGPSTESARVIDSGALPIQRLPQRMLSFSAITSGLDTSSEPLEVTSSNLSQAVPGTTDKNSPHPEIALLDRFRGAQFGILVHSLLEHRSKPHDISVLQNELRQAIDPSLIALSADVMALEALLACMHRALQIQLADGMCISDVAFAQTAQEYAFQFPIYALPASQLQALGAEFGLPALRIQRALDTERRPAQMIVGADMLMGVIDLIVPINGRFHIVDYKTNYLGPHLQDYAPDALQVAVADADYYLQILLYTLALHRLLKARLPDYQYDAHIGETHYLFLRAVGLSDDTHRAYGHFMYRPPQALIERLDFLLCQPRLADAT